MRLCTKCRVPLTGDDWSCASCGARPPVRDGWVELSTALDDERGGFEVSGFSELFEHEASHFWFRSRNRLIAWAIRRYFPRPRRIFEIGCGTGFVLSHLERSFSDAELSGGEAYPEALAFAATRLRRARLYQLDVRALPFEDEFDVVGAFDVLEHVPEDETALAEMRRVTRATGGVVLTVPQHPWLWSRSDESAHHVRRYTRADLVAKVQRAGFDVVRCSSFVTSLLPPMIVSRWMARREPKEHVADREFALPRALDAAFGAMLGAERAAIRAGLSLPVGGSLLLVARRREEVR
ncbi:MAG: methyltransferase domain-containing protein [Labilithrix sp.]|nr:methyltransferase domain-containing protein [Labilithrix sp.]